MFHLVVHYVSLTSTKYGGVITFNRAQNVAYNTHVKSN